MPENRVLVLLETLEPGNIHTGIFNGLLECGVPVQPIVLPRDGLDTIEKRSALLTRLLAELPAKMLVTIGPNDHLLASVFHVNKYVVSIQIDDPWALDHHKATPSAGYDEILTSCPAADIESRYRKLTGNSALNTHYLPFGIDPTVFHHMPTGASVPSYAILFLGSDYRKRQRAAETLIKREFPCKYIGPGSHKQWSHGRISPWELPFWFNRASVCVSFSDQPDGILSQKIRPYEIAASGGGCLLIEDEPSARYEFSDDEAVFWHSLDDLYEKGMALLADPLRCRELSRNALRLAHPKFSWATRLRPHVERWRDKWA